METFSAFLNEQTLDSLSCELQIFEKIIYKSKNQHRRGGGLKSIVPIRVLFVVYYRKLIEIRKLGRTLKQRLPVLASQGKDGPSSADVCYSYIELIWHMLSACLKASELMLEMLGQSYFMVFALISLSCISRFYALLRPVLQTLVKTFRLAYPSTRALDQIDFALLHGTRRLEYDALTAFSRFEAQSPSQRQIDSLSSKSPDAGLAPSPPSAVSSQAAPAADFGFLSDLDSEDDVDREIALRLQQSRTALLAGSSASISEAGSMYQGRIVSTPSPASFVFVFRRCIRSIAVGTN